MNAPEAGTIKEFLVNEEDTVTVGQDIVRIETGGAPSAAPSEAKPEEKKAPEPEPSSEDAPKPPPKSEPKEAAPPPPKPEASKPEPTKTPSQTSPESKGSSAAPVPTIGGREERRVGISSFWSYDIV